MKGTTYDTASWLALVIGFITLTLSPLAIAVEFSSVEFAGKRFTVCQVDLRKERLRLFLRDDKGQPLKRFQALSRWTDSQKQRLVFAMNAGMFESDFSPVGLF